MTRKEIQSAMEKIYLTKVRGNMDEIKPVRDIIEEVKNDVCEKLCKYPLEEGHSEDWLFEPDSPCNTICPLRKL